MKKTETPKDVLSWVQLTVVLISMILGVDNFIMPRLVGVAAGRDGWMAIIISSLWIMVVARGLVYVGELYPRQPPHIWMSKLFGKWIARFFTVSYILYFLALSAWVLRSFASMTRVYLLPTTPVEVIMITFTFSIAYLVVNGVNPMARVTQVLFVFTIIPSLLLLIMFRINVDFGEILPVLGNGIMPVMKGLIPGISAFVGWGIIIYLMQFMDEPQKAKKAVTIGIGSVGILFLWAFIISLATYGPLELRYLVYPVVDVIREMEGLGTFIEKFDLILLTVWIMSVFVTLAFAYYVTVLAGSQLLGLEEQHTLVYSGLPLVYFLALLPKSYIQIEEVGYLIGYASLGYSIGIPLMVLWVLFKNRQGGKTDGQEN